MDLVHGVNRALGNGQAACYIPPCPEAIRWLVKQTDPVKAWRAVPFRSWRGWFLRNTGYWVGIGWEDATKFDRLTHDEQLKLLPRPPL